MKTLPSFHHLIKGPEHAPWLTFIPGIGNDASFWARQADALASDFRVLCFDPWGHGDSPLPPEDCHFSDIVEGILQLWDGLGIEKSSLVGLGFGGSVALALAIQAPERVERVSAFCCRARQPDDRRDFWRARCDAAVSQGIERLTEATVDRWLSEAFRAREPQVDLQLRQMMKRTRLQGYLAYVQAFIEMDFSKQIATLNVPTQLVAAEHDHGGGPAADMQVLAELIPQAEFIELKGVGHICNFEASAEVERLLKAFLLK